MRPKRESRLSALSTLATIAALAAFLSASGCATTDKAQLAREWYDIGNAWFDKGEWKKAGASYSRAIALDPRLAAASFNLARALAEAEDYEGALQVADDLLVEDPGNVRVVALRAWALYKTGEAKAAIAAYDGLLELDPYAPDAIYNVALIRSSLGEKERAAADLEPLLRAKPEDYEALALAAKLYDDLGRDEGSPAPASSPTDEPVAAAPVPPTEAPGAAPSGAQRATRTKREYRQLAIEAYEKLNAAKKAGPEALERLGLMYEEDRRFAEAIETLAAATAAGAERYLAWFALARLRLVVAEDEKGGIEALRKALEAGFVDRAAADALLAEPILPGRETVLQLLTDKGLAGSSTQTAPAAGDSGAAAEGTGGSAP
jgi:tetratricopeptide (TPR) repeat protein